MDPEIETTMTAEQFGAAFTTWVDRHELSLSGTAALFDCSRKVITDWKSGKRLPGTWRIVRLAMLAVDLRPELARGVNPKQRRRVPGELAASKAQADGQITTGTLHSTTRAGRRSSDHL